ncbi:serine/threonine protein phosphatase [Rivularia sp. PCC 7116]|uniref:protein phosphatase 2C domain-containing protein n=1 Tax=Rivularia sp. PCC 7116 TaxID=373994 RepID=UPI00029EF2C8|nr:protein phosphatase 2C domain-containing protein [Rivularia sp. PCC 7116]AFY53672.1 serine/threonine protein phosphatase [Rivularia sp. PCC 7116]
MENDAATLYCPNELCQAANPLTHKFCQRCSTPLPKRYLWAVADNSIVGNSGELLQERYLIIEHNVLLDTKPGILPQMPEQQKLDDIKSYLRLIPYRLHVPQVYGMLSVNTGNTSEEILILEKPPLVLNELPTKVQLCGELTDAWKGANSLRQLNWLWQIAQLWQPLASVGVASSLLAKKLLRAEGSIVRLLELSSDRESKPSLLALGKFWQQELLPKAQSTIRNFMGEVCRLLVEEQIHSSEQLIAVLDNGLTSLGKCSKIDIRVFALTDTGPSRQRNEDSCYPQSGTTVSKPPSKSALTIVCDGIGGHEGGDIASKTAIETIEQSLTQLASLPKDRIHPAVLLADLERAAAIANDKISQLNDSENRQGRQRMGTTVVMALPLGHEMYISHVGDSRAYLITQNNCHQVTLDDDVASREVRLGYAVYRDAVAQAASGSLVQALGMNASSALHPTAQRFILDEDCVFLLCSDGLSDFDRVEQYWEAEILPLLKNSSDVVSVTKQLLEIANNQNGHDNVTIASMHCQTKYSEPKSALETTLADISSISVTDSSHLAPVRQNLPNQKTQVITKKANIKGFNLPLILGIIALLTIAGGSLGYFWRQGIIRSKSEPREVAQTENIPPKIAEPTFETNSQRIAQIDKGWLISAKAKLNLSKSTLPPADNNSSARRQPLPIFAPPASLLQVVQKQQISSSQDYWLQIKVCSVGDVEAAINSATATTGSRTLLKPGEQVWLNSSQLTPSNVSISNPANKTSQCTQAETLAPKIEDSSTSVPVEDSLIPSQPSIPSKPDSLSGSTTLPQTGNSTDSKTR